LYALLQTTQALFQFDWGSNFIQSSLVSPFQLQNSAGTAPVYISKTGVAPSVFTNPKGTLSYTFVKTGATTGTSTGTAISTTAFSDSKVGGVGTIIGAASNTTFNLPNIFNTTYKNYKIHLSFGQNAFTQYPTITLSGFLGSNVPGTADVFGYDINSAGGELVQERGILPVRLPPQKTSGSTP